MTKPRPNTYFYFFLYFFVQLSKTPRTQILKEINNKKQFRPNINFCLFFVFVLQLSKNPRTPKIEKMKISKFKKNKNSKIQKSRKRHVNQRVHLQRCGGPGAAAPGKTRCERWVKNSTLGSVSH